MTGLKIGLVVSGRYPRIDNDVFPNGVITYVRGQAKALSDRGHDVTVISKLPAAKHIHEWKLDGIRAVGLPFASFGGFSEGVHRYVTTHRQDVLEAHQMEYPLLLEQILGDTPTVTRYASDYLDELYDSYRYDWLPTPAGDLARYSGSNTWKAGLEQAKRSSLVLCAGSVQKRRLLECGVYSVELPLGIDEVVDRAKESTHMLLIFVGRLGDSRKGGSFVTRLINSLPCDQWTDVFVVGNGSDEERMRFNSEVKYDNVSLCPGIPKSQLLDYIDAAECVIVPSRSESFGYVFLEPLARGKPVVCFHQKDETKNRDWPLELRAWESEHSFASLRSAVESGRFVHTEEQRLTFARKFLWSNLVERYEETYNRAIVNHEKNKVDNNGSIEVVGR